METRREVLEVFGAGVAAEFVNKVVLHPIDTLKARLQYQRAEVLQAFRRAAAPEGSLVRRASRWPFISDVFASAALLRAEIHPLRSLFAGLSPSLLGVLPVSLVYMPTYELSKARLHGTLLEHTPAAAVATGAASALVRVPVSVLKARLQLKLHKDLGTSLREVLSQKRGVWGLYVGLRAVLLLDVTYSAVQFTCIEYFRRVAHGRQAGSDSAAAADKELSVSTNALIGFATGVITSLVTEPIDVVKTRLMAQRTASGSGPREGVFFGYRGVVHGLRQAVRSEGIMALWKGSVPRLVIKACGSSLWFTTYMGVRSLLSAEPSPSR